MKSTEMNVRDAQVKVAEMTDPEEIRSFISGDERKTVIDAAHKRIIEMMDKPASGGKASETVRRIIKGTVLFIHSSVGNIFEPKQMKKEVNDKIEPSLLFSTPKLSDSF